MTAEQFCYWLHGFFELQDADKREREGGLTEEQREVINDHLNLVFQKETPDRSVKKKVLTEDSDPGARKRFQELLDELKRSQPGVTCQLDPFEPHPGIGTGRIC